MTKFYFKYGSATGSQHGQYQDPETEADKLNSTIIHFIIHLFFSYCDVSKCLPIEGLLSNLYVRQTSYPDLWLSLFDGACS